MKCRQPRNVLAILTERFTRFHAVTPNRRSEDADLEVHYPSKISQRLLERLSFRYYRAT